MNIHEHPWTLAILVPSSSIFGPLWSTGQVDLRGCLRLARTDGASSVAWQGASHIQS
jgi:hypothetical protein